MAAVGLCCSVYVYLSALASPSPMILPPVSGKERHRDTERVVTELRLYIFQFCSKGSGRLADVAIPKWSLNLAPEPSDRG